MTSMPKEPYIGFKSHLSAHRAKTTSHAIRSTVRKQSTLYKDGEATFTMTAMPRMVPKVSQNSSRIGTPTFEDKSKPISPDSSGTIKPTYSILGSVGNLHHSPP